ncbi:MAG: hypothetical protein O2985_01830 [Proteobacteria bacterium]|nr:hypothetical protein [Pseudomonadota bacterium]
MNQDRFRVLIEGALAAWQLDVELVFAATEPICRILRDGEEVLAVSIEDQPFGMIWRIVEPGRRDRVHPSIVPALRGLREILCPDRATGRVLFVAGEGA